MQLRHVDPRLLLDNPNNPRRIAVGEHFDAQLAASIRATNGPVQAPIAKELPDGRLQLIAGHRRKYASIAAEIPEIAVLVRDDATSGDSMAAFAENMMRSPMAALDVWRAVEAFIGEGYTEDGIATALTIPKREVRRLRLFANVHPAILERIAQGDEPQEHQLRIIAAASREDQAAAWKAHKPKRGERTEWYRLERALRRVRMSAQVARFDDALAAECGVVWTEDLFAPADADPRYTENVEAFMAAQELWLERHRPRKADLLPVDQHGSAKLPPRAFEVYSNEKKAKGVRLGLWLCRHSGEVKEKYYLVPDAPSKTRAGSEDEDGRVIPLRVPRPDISGPGQELIGRYRTDALHQALNEGEITDAQLMGALVLALAGRNVSVHQDARHWKEGSRREHIAQEISEDGLLTQDVPALRSAARRMLKLVLSCSLGMSDSGDVARIAGASINADAYLPDMATDEFLPKLSKDGITRVLQSQNVLPRNTGKQMREAWVQHLAGASWVHPEALFDLSDGEKAERARKLALRRSMASATDEEEEGNASVEDAGAEGEDPSEEDEMPDALLTHRGMATPATERAAA